MDRIGGDENDVSCDGNEGEYSELPRSLFSIHQLEIPDHVHLIRTHRRSFRTGIQRKQLYRQNDAILLRTGKMTCPPRVTLRPASHSDSYIQRLTFQIGSAGQAPSQRILRLRFSGTEVLPTASQHRYEFISNGPKNRRPSRSKYLQLWQRCRVLFVSGRLWYIPPECHYFPGIYRTRGKYKGHIFH